MHKIGVSFRIPDRYESQNTRLTGGQGYVYKYKDAFLQRAVAIKEMKYPADAGALRDELARIREIRSRHVVEVYDLFEAKRSDSVALVEEYVDGPTLEEWATANTAPSESNSVKVLWQIACGLADVHAHGIIHRDIKPQNMRLDTEGVVKILDFGLSSIADPDAETLASRGTVHYLAPELYQPPPIPLSQQIDVYAFGVTAWYLLNGGVLPRTLKETPPQSSNPVHSLRTAKVALPRRLTDLLDQALDRDPRNRPTMDRIRDVLRGQITSGQHRLVFPHEGAPHVLSKTTPRVTLTLDRSSLTINYDEFNFVIQMVEGEVYLNNAKAEVGMALPDSCVITFGDSAEGPHRTFVPMTVLAPEVVL